MKTLEPPILLRLSDLCADVFTFTLELQRTKDPGSAEELRRQVQEHFNALDRRAVNVGLDAGDVQMGRYALAALIDEIVLTSQWPARDEWTARPLQLEYFNDLAAGEEFYNKVETLRANPQKIDVLEVFALCLGLGFRGKYADLSGMDKRKALMQALGREIRAARGQESSALAERWMVSEHIPQKVRNQPLWIFASICAAWVVLLFVVLNTLLGWQVSAFKTKVDQVRTTTGR